MQPTSFDVKIIQWMAPLRGHPFIVDAVDTLSSSSLFTGLIFAVPVFVIWHRSGVRRTAAQRLIITIMLATIIGALGSIVVQQFFRWPPPSSSPATAAFYAVQFQYNENPNSFPSDSTMLYSTVAFGVATWNRFVGVSLLAWRLVFIAPARIFVGGHYASDIVAGLFVGFFSYVLSRHMTRNSRLVEWLSLSCSPIALSILFVWLFEVGKGFADVRQVANALWHLRRHM